MAYTHLNQDRPLKDAGLTFWTVFALGFAIVFTIALTAIQAQDMKAANR